MFDTLRSVVRFRRFDADSVRRRLSRAAGVADLRLIAKDRLPGGVFDYADGGAEDELSLAANREAYQRVTFRPRVLRNVESVDPSTTLLGRPLPMPLVLAPIGFTRMFDPEGELASARAAAKANLPYTLSTMGTRSIEEVAAVSDGPKWFQVYVLRDHELTMEMIGRAAAAGFEAIVLTVDNQVPGRRERDVRRGFTLPPKIGLDTIVDGIRHPSWTWRFMRSEPIRFANIVGHGDQDGSDPVSLSEFVNSQYDPGLTWKDLDWIRSVWDGPIIIKGIQSVEDAVLAADAGIQAIALSNHGGRQLDGGPATLDLVAPVADAVGDRIEIICDGGVRRGSDILKAVALGARACMAGRAYVYGLGAGGQRGVEYVLGLLEADIRRTMALIGVASIDELDREAVDTVARLR